MVKYKHSERYIDGFCDMLKSEGLKCTSIRQNILRIFFLNTRLTIVDIIYQLSVTFKDSATKPSIYATLKLLQSYNIITKVQNKNKTCYELTNHKKSYYLQCITCNKSKEFSDESLLKSITILSKKEYFKISNIDMVIYGRCQECVQEK